MAQNGTKWANSTIEPKEPNGHIEQIEHIEQVERIEQIALMEHMELNALIVANRTIDPKRPKRTQ